MMRIGVEGLTVAFGRSKVLRGVDLEIAPGEVVAVLGANGSGKSTLLRAIAGVQAHAGRLTWNGATARPHAGIGYMPQDNAARVGLTVFEVVLLGRLRSLALRVGQADLAAAEAALAELGITALAQRRLGELSGGQRQLAFLAQVLAGEPQALLLDEPTSALDIAHQLHVLDLLASATQRRGLTTLAVLHDLNAAARFAHRIALLCDGRIACVGTPRAVLVPDRLRDVYGVEVAVVDGPDGHPMVLPLRVA